MDSQSERIVLGMVIVVIVAATMYCNHQVYRECRAEHSWMYCARLLGL